MTLRSLAALSLAGLGVLWLTGCGESEAITRYTVPKPHVVYEKNHLPPAEDARPALLPMRRPDAGTAAERMLGAIVPQGERTWFFKLSGSTQAIAPQVQNFVAFVLSLDFEQPDRPQWMLPEDWRQEPGRGMRYATIKIDPAETGAGQPLDLSVIPLPTGAGDYREYVLSNVNRWRGELDLEPVTLDQLSEQSREVRLRDGTTATFVHLWRETPLPAAATDAPPRQEPAAGLSYDAPEGWSAGQVVGLRKAAFEVQDGEQKVEITAIDLAASAGGLLPNVNRWREQIGLGETTAEELLREVRTLDLGGTTGQYFELVGPSDSPRPETILAVIAVEGPRAWFFKLQGDSGLAAREKERFEQFVQSVRFDREGAGNGR